MSRPWAANVSYLISDDFKVVGKGEVKITIPALEAARWACECCKNDDELRVCKGDGGVVVLCVVCRLRGGFRLVVNSRRRSA